MPGSVLVEGDAPAMSRPRKYPDELRERAVRLVFESKRPIAHAAQDLGIHKESRAIGCGRLRPMAAAGVIC
jgi:hypothetical protein